MAAESNQEEKTEEATQQRREDFRKRGQVAQTKELTSALVLLASILAIWFLGKFFLVQLGEVFTRSFSVYIIDSARSGDWVPAFKFAINKTFLIVSPLLGILWIMSFSSSVLQIGFLTNEEAMQFKFERLNPVEGLKRLFSMRSLIEGLKAIAKVVIILTIVALIIEAEVIQIPTLTTYNVEQLFIYVGEVTVRIVGAVGFFMITLAGLDYMFQRWDLEKKMRMTRQEVKEELKSREGDPLIKARIRRVQREMASKRMMEDVPKSDIVITNPTHIAVALKYGPDMVAPTIVAKGAGLIAEKIKDLAKENKVPVMENKPLARTIYKTLQIGQTIPRELYTAVAEVLSYVFNLKKKKAGVS